ncbi:MAG: LamG domain-containing protein, partial [archaeon]
MKGSYKETLGVFEMNKKLAISLGILLLLIILIGFASTSYLGKFSAKLISLAQLLPLKITGFQVVTPSCIYNTNTVISTDTYCGSILITNGARVNVTAGVILNSTIFTINGNSQLTASQGRAVKINTVDLTIASGSSIVLDYLGYTSGNGPGEGCSGTGSGEYGTGAYYGGVGGISSEGVLCPLSNTYGLISKPSVSGSGGGGHGTAMVCWPPVLGGSGGGIIIINASGTFSNSGTITSNGRNGDIGGLGNSCMGGGGSGGSIYIIAGSLSGNGIIRANAGNGGGALGASQAGGGGGGRIAIYSCSDSSSYNVQVNKGLGWRNGTDGTYVKVNNIGCGLLPKANFTFPTPIKDFSTNKESIIVNVSISQALSSSKELYSIYFNFNNSVHQFYNANNLVLHMNLDNNPNLGENSNRAIDNSFYSNNGSLLDGAFFTQGKYGLGVEFDGINDKIDLGDLQANPDLQAYSDMSGFTIMAWAKSKGASSEPNFALSTIFGASESNTEGYWLGCFWSNNCYFVVGNGAGYISSGNVVVPNIANWNHIVGVFNKTDVAIWINGEYQTSTGFSGSYNPSERNISIGYNQYNPTFTWNGTIDEVVIFKRALSSEDIKYFYNSQLKKYNSTDWNLYINQTNLALGQNYTYQACISNNIENIVCTEVHSLNISFPINPIKVNFTYPTPPHNFTTSNKSAQINATIIHGAPPISQINWSWNYTNYSFYDDSLVLHLNLDNNLAIGENSTKAVDVSNYGNNGTFLNGASWTSSGKYSSALSFDGVNDYVKILDSGSLKMPKFSVEGWFNTESNSYDVLIGKYSPTLNAGWYVAINEPPFYQSKIGLVLPSKNGVYSNSIINDSKWHHFIFTFDGSNIKSYIDGNLENTITGISGYSSSSNNLSVGAGVASTGASAYFFNGRIDEVRIYNRRLSSQEVWQHYSSNLKKYNSSYWEFYSNQSNLSYGTHYYQVCASDVSGNLNCTETRILNTVYSDLEPPYFEPLPSSQTRVYLTPFAYSITAKDNINISCFKVNSSLFSINCSGYLKNATTIGVGNYYLNITINDTSNNLNSTALLVNITKAAGNIILLLNGSASGFTEKIGELVNISAYLSSGVGNFKVYSGGSLIYSGNKASENLTSYSSAGLKNITTIYSGNENYTSNSKTLWITVLDIIPPDVNATTPGIDIETNLTEAIFKVNIDRNSYDLLGIYNWTWNYTNYSFYDDSLVLHLNLDNNTEIGDNSTKAVDSSKYGNNGNINGASWNASGKYSSALSFDGVDDSVNFSDSNSLRLKSSFSIEVWIKPFTELDSQPSWFHIVSKINSTTPRSGYFLGGDGIAGGNGKLACGFYNISGDVRNIWPVNLNPAAKNEWSHVVCTYDYDTGFI